MKLLTIPALALAAAAAVSAQAADSKKDAKQGGNPNDVVCFTAPLTGSHIKKRVCMTQAERERRAKEDQDAMTKLHRSSAGASAPSPGP